MTPLNHALSQITVALTAAKVEFALIGGLAVSVRTEPRFTRDADLAVAVGSDPEAESLIFSLQNDGYAVQAIVEQQAVSRLATVRLASPEEEPSGILVDLLFASSGIEPEIVGAAETLDIFPDLRLPVARSGHLIALKLLSRDDLRRPQDIADLRALLLEATSVELQRAEAAVRLIEARGFHRGRDLTAALEQLRREPDAGAS